MPKTKLPFKEFLWTPELAYAIGLLVTDGNLSKDGRHITMRSSKQEQLRTFAQCLQLKNKIGVTHTDSHTDGYIRRPCYRVQFSDVQFYNWLIRIGITPAKSHTVGAIKIPDFYFRDFLRGHLDGDGSIHAYEDRYNVYRGRTYTNQRIFTRFISASKLHMLWLQEKINKLAGVRGAFICEKPQSKNRVPIWELKFAKKESLKLLHWIYYKPNLPCLERKRERALRTVDAILHTQRRPYTRITA